MNDQYRWWLALPIIALFLIACQPIQPISTNDSPSTELAIYTDQHGFFTAQYPADWVVEPYLFGDEMPIPHVAINSDTEISEKSMAWEPLPEDQIGVGIILIPRSMFAEAGLTADTPLDEAVRLILSGMGADDPEAVAEMIAQATFEEITLANGTPACVGPVIGPDRSPD